MNNDFFSINKVPYQGMEWVYVNAKKVLLGVLGQMEDGRYVLIKQYRPPIDKWVISVPMGAFPEIEDRELLMKITKEECEGETGFPIEEIEFLTEYYRSPGLTNEKMILYKAKYGSVPQTQVLHFDEEILPLVISLEELQVLLKSGDYYIDSSVLMLYNS